ncbi:MAG: siphovirus Gp157 family protein [Planctomycetes bacterium]|nr:siphovirus Gp157 family protein [Planctomycetota bacterium]
MTRTVLDITRDMDALDALLAEVEGDVTDPKVQDAVAAWFAELDADLKGKVDNYAALITTLEVRADVRAKEAERLARRAKTDAASAQFLKDRLRGELEARGIQKVETDRYRVSVIANGGKLPLVLGDEREISDAYWREVPARKEIDRDAIRQALDAGRTVAGAHYGERGRRLSIR